MLSLRFQTVDLGPFNTIVRGGLDQAPRAEFCRGWFSFMRDNNLEEGDICTFELTNRNNNSFNVFIVKANGHRPLVRNFSSQ